MYLDIPKECLNIYKIMDHNDIMFSYKGPITQDILVAVGDSIKKKFPSGEIGYNIIKKIFAVFIEEAQNVLKHSYEKHYNHEQKGTGIGLIGVGRKNHEYFFVFSGNMIQRSSEGELKSHLDHINSLNKEELKKYYNKKRKTGTLSEEGGAGLGFIDMARRSGRPLEYWFEIIDDDRTFFEVLIKIPCKDVGE